MKLTLVSVLLCIATTVFSQRQYFIFVESENRQPIFVRIGETTYNSSSIGHVIVPGLSDSAYTLEIGLAGDQTPSNQYIIKVNRKDHGYQLKKLSDKGWVLFNFQTLELLYPVKKDGLMQSGYSLIKRDDGFARLLSQVVNDTAVLYSIVYQRPVETVLKPQPKPAVDSIVAKKEEVVTNKEVNNKKEDSAASVAVKSEEIKAPVEEKATQLPKLPVVAVAKVREVESDSGKHVVFVDDKDSIQIFIASNTQHEKPTTEELTKEQKKQESSELTAGTPDKNVVTSPTTSNKQNTEAAKKSDAEIVTQTVAKKEVKDTSTQQKKLVLLNSDCRALAWDSDVDKVRLKMLAEKDVDNKIAVAKKVFKAKCFTAAQLKGLTELFTTDEDKYKFLDAAYPFVFDTENFKQLSYLLTDEYYVKRFRTMVRLD